MILKSIKTLQLVHTVFFLLFYILLVNFIIFTNTRIILYIIYSNIISSLCHGGYSEVADGLLVDIIRRLAVFGLTLCPLDLRQESGRHEDAIDSITRNLGIGSYAQWDELTKINWLQNELAGKRPLIRTDDIGQMGFKPTVIDTLKTLEMAS